MRDRTVGLAAQEVRQVRVDIERHVRVLRQVARAIEARELLARPAPLRDALQAPMLEQRQVAQPSRLQVVPRALVVRRVEVRVRLANRVLLDFTRPGSPSIIACASPSTEGCAMNV